MWEEHDNTHDHHDSDNIEDNSNFCNSHSEVEIECDLSGLFSQPDDAPDNKLLSLFLSKNPKAVVQSHNMIGDNQHPNRMGKI
jgi:hypothetical protein